MNRATELDALRPRPFATPDRILGSVSEALGAACVLAARFDVGRAQLAAAPPPAITHVTVVPMDRERVLSDQTVLVRGGRIVAVGPAARVAVPPGVRHVDGGRRFLLPGLVDAHVHHLEERRVPRPLGAAVRRRYAALSLAAGVTTAFNPRGSLHAPASRDSVARGAALGPGRVAPGRHRRGRGAGADQPGAFPAGPLTGRSSR